jgi:hypothetical protein
VIWWYELLPTLILVGMAVVAPLNHPDSPAMPPFVVRPQFDAWIYDSTNYNGEFRRCSVRPKLQCAITFEDDP